MEPEVGVEPTTFRLRGKRSSSDWTGLEGNRLLMLGADSIWSGRDGGRSVVWMINAMINAHSIRCRADHRITACVINSHGVWRSSRS
jgi:hypothetical protein